LLREVNSAYDAIGRGAFVAAVADARDGDSLDPLSVDPLWAWAGAETALGNKQDALDLFERATRRQPENASTWFSLGDYRLEGLRDPCHAYDALNHAYTLDPWGPAGRRGACSTRPARCGTRGPPADPAAGAMSSRFSVPVTSDRHRGGEGLD
jgi:tetratricopeptide (TPR) repeat protein